MITNLTINKGQPVIPQGQGHSRVFPNRAWIPRSFRAVTSPLLAKRRITVIGASRGSAMSRRPSIGSGKKNIPGVDLETLEYDWPDLPPIDQIKDALSRTRVSKGVSYILPIDKSKNGVENTFRTDLRFMFKDPYKDHLKNYHEDRVIEGNKHHFVPNAPADQFHVSPDDYTKYKLNAESDKVRRSYMISAPPKGLVGKHTTPNSQELRTRSNLYQPLKIKLPDEAKQMREEAQKIFQSITEKHEDEPSKKDEINAENKRKLSKPEGGSTDAQECSTTGAQNTKQVHLDGTKEKTFQKKASLFESYEDLKNTPHPEKPVLPNSFKSPFLSDEKNQEIWSWLTKDETITDFKHFLSICS